MTINPLGAIPKDPSRGGSPVVHQQPRSDQYARQMSILTLINGQDEDEDGCSSLPDTLDGSFALQEMSGDEFRDNLRSPQDPLEKRVEQTVNAVFERRKLMESRGMVEDYGISAGDSFSIQCWGDKQCNIPATCCSTFVCRWLCCCCSKCVTRSTPYEQLDKHLIRKECTTSYKDSLEIFSVYVPQWFAKLFLQMQNARWNEDTRFSTEDMILLKQEFFSEPKIPWIGVAPLLQGVNIMRMLTEANSLLKDPLRKKPPWTTWRLLKKSRNAVERVSQCKFLGTELSLEFIAEWLLMMPTEDEKFDGSGTMRKIYDILCSNISIYAQPMPGSELDPAMVMGLLLRILEKLKISYTPSESLKSLAFDCDTFKNVCDLSFETQTRILALVRSALDSRHEFWYDRFNAHKQEDPLPEIIVEPKKRGCSGCCTGCSSCCRSSCVSATEDDQVLMQVITQQPASGGSLPRSSSGGFSSAAPSPSIRRHHPHQTEGIGYGLMGLSSTAGVQKVSPVPPKKESSKEDLTSVV